MNVKELRRQVKEAIKRFPQTAVVYRAVKNEFGEECGLEFVTHITGHYYRSNLTRVPKEYMDKGAVKGEYAERFMTTLDDVSRLVCEGDYLRLDGETYQITDLGLTNDIYFDYSIMRAESYGFEY